MEITGSPKFLEAMAALKRLHIDYRLRDAVIDEVKHLQERLEFFRPKCAQCDAPLEVHPYQCKLYGLCDRCVGEVREIGPGPMASADHATIEYTPGQPVDLSKVTARYLHFRPKPEPIHIPLQAIRMEIAEAPTSQLSPVTADEIVNMLAACPGCGHAGCAINSEGCAAGQCACEALKRPDPNTISPRGHRVEPVPSLDTIAGAVLAQVCPFCHGARHDPDPEKNAGMCPEIPF